MDGGEAIKNVMRKASCSTDSVNLASNETFLGRLRQDEQPPQTAVAERPSTTILISSADQKYSSILLILL